MIFNALIIGLGNIAVGFDLNSGERDIYTHSKAYLNHSKVNLIGGIDPSQKQRVVFNNFSSKNSWCDISDFLKKCPWTLVDIVSICTPTFCREDIITETIDRLNPKAILLEKPIARDVHEALRILELQKKTKVMIYVNYFRSFLESFQILSSEIKSMKYGRIQSIDVCYSKGLFNNASHYLNVLSLIFDGEPDIEWTSKASKTPGIEDVDLDFVLTWHKITIIFRVVNEKNFSIGEIDFVFEKARFTLKDYGFFCEKSFVEQDSKFNGYSHLVKKEVINNFIGQDYMLQVINNVIDSTIDNGETNMKNAFTTLSICEKIKKKAHVS